MTPMSTSSTRCRKDHDGELTRRTPAIHFVMLELEDGGVAPIEDAADIYFVKLEPEGAEHVGMVPRAAEDGETELVRTTPVIFFIKSAPWRTKAWRLATMPPPCRLGWRRGARQDDAQRQHPVPRRIVAWSSQGGHHQHQHHQAGPEAWSSRDITTKSTSSRWSPRHGAKKITHTLGAVRDLEEKMVPHDGLHDPEPMKMRRDGEEAM